MMENPKDTNEKYQKESVKIQTNNNNGQTGTKKGKLLTILSILAIGGIIWSVASFFNKQNSTDPQAITNYKNINSNDLAMMLKNKDFLLIDTHIPEQAHIPGTDKFIPFNEIEARLSELPQNKNAKIVLYCRSGGMSKLASKTLINLGYKNIYNLEGGINGWKANGYKVENISLKK